LFEQNISAQKQNMIKSLKPFQIETKGLSVIVRFTIATPKLDEVYIEFTIDSRSMHNRKRTTTR
jgi:hypothetical protein